MLWQWYSESGDVDKAISVMTKALQKHSAAITAGGHLFSVISRHMLLDYINESKVISGLVAVGLNFFVV